MRMKERCFRIPATMAGFSSGLFGAALSFWFSEPPTQSALDDLKAVVSSEAIVQKKLALDDQDMSLLGLLKDFYKIPHDYEAVSLVIAHAVKHNPFFA